MNKENASRNKNQRSNKKQTQSNKTAPSRLSARLRSVAPSNPQGLVEDDLPKVSSKKSSKLSHRAVELTDEDRAKLEHLPNWVNQFQDFLVQVDHISETNCRRAMRQVEKMATGVGITYRHWEKGIWFYRGTQIDPSFDFDKLYDEAVELEREHGKDLGNGWLMRHPLVKLKKFQQYLYLKQSEKGKDSEGSG
ncbi:expressed unknown protein [Seminavis robusta]|nr:expressed unknown protein [Seminavis robusta]|eukprot:Sro1558_g282310.1 n/a (193) ;mRNA; r:1951-2529